jgi:hypothetical protein
VLVIFMVHTGKSANVEALVKGSGLNNDIFPGLFQADGVGGTAPRQVLVLTVDTK